MQKTLLIVEDDPDLADMLSAYFRVQGYKVSSAGWGEDAVRLATKSPPDAILLDIRLPDIDGYEVCRRLRQNRVTQNIPIVFLTEKRERENKLAGLQLGAVDYITKPFDIQELRLRIRNLLRRTQQSSMVNPVTGLPDGQLVQEQMEKLLSSPKWGIVTAKIRGLEQFRNTYGFVAADDVARAVSLMLTNALQECGAEDDFVGHLDNVDFIVLTDSGKEEKIVESCRIRLQPSIQYFYPTMDRERLKELSENERLTVEIDGFSSQEQPVTTIDELHALLYSG